MDSQAPKHDDVPDWSRLERGQRITFHHNDDGPVTGVLDEWSDEASVLWVHLANGAGRRLIHREDGFLLEGSA